MSKTTSDIEMWYGNTFNPEVSIISNLIYSLYFEAFSLHNYSHVITISKSAIHDKLFLKKLENIDIVVVIGESFNKYHSSLYGYSHNTNPNLLEERRKGNLYVFTAFNHIRYFNGIFE